MRVGLITGTSLTEIMGVSTSKRAIDTPFGSPSSEFSCIEIGGHEVFVLARHGLTGSIGAHTVNYRANVWAFQAVEVTHIIATATVGGINENLHLGDLVIPDQIIDYTYDRHHTYEGHLPLRHFDFTFPFSSFLRDKLTMHLSRSMQREVNLAGTYGCTQGPRLETAAEIRRMCGDGCDVVGMTLMPEASLARELSLDYAAVCMNVNAAAGINGQSISIKSTRDITRSFQDELRWVLIRTIESL